MSGPIRKLIGPAKSRLQQYIESANILLEKKPNETELDEEESEAEDFINRISCNVTLLEKCNKDWSNVLRETKGDAKVAEEREYARVSEGEGGFIDVLMVANEVSARLKARITLISRKREQVTRVRPLTSPQGEFQSIIEQAAIQATRAAIQESLSTSTSMSQHSNSNTGPSNQLSIRLPKLHLPTFDGYILKWPEFWDIYESSVHRQDIPNVSKFSYLKGALRGSAFMAIAGISVTNENYDVAIQLLKEKFGNKESIIEALYAKLQHLPTSSNRFNDIKHTYEVIERLLRQLESQGEIVNQQKMLIHQLLSKFPLEVVIKLEDVKKCDQVWTMELLRRLLNQYVMVQENAQRHVFNARGYNSEFRQGRQGNRQYANQYTSAAANDQTSNQSSTETFATNVQRKTRSGFRSQNPCVFCQGEHFNDECDQYKVLTERKQRLLSLGRCFLCFKVGHTFRDCPLNQKSSCYYCGKRGHHNRAICPQKFENKQEEKAENSCNVPESSNVSADKTCNQSGKPINSTSASFEQTLLVSGERVLLQTATVPIQTADGSKRIFAKVLLDSSSHRTFMTDRLAKQLKLNPQRKEMLTVSTFAARSPQDVSTYVVHFNLMTKDGSYLQLHANVINQITGPIQRGPLQSSYMDFLLSISADKMADSIPKSSEPTTVDLLIGSDYFWSIVDVKKVVLPSGLYLVSSKIGYILTGKYVDPIVEQSSSQQCISSCFVMTQVNSTVPEMNLLSTSDASITGNLNIEDFWKLETIGISDPLDVTDDDKALEQFNKTICYKDGRYQVTWPWKCENPDLPVNLGVAMGRIRSLARRFQGDKDLLKNYDDILQGQVKKGIIEKVTKNMKEGERKHYLPHHPVITPTKSTTRLRIVYDASAKARKGDRSLNECLYRGPVLLPDLCGILLRFRIQPIAIFADIEKAFLQVGIQESDRDVTRFLWFRDLTNLETNERNLDTYRFCRVPFGIVCSPFLLGGTIKFHLRKVGTPVALYVLVITYMWIMFLSRTDFR